MNARQATGWTAAAAVLALLLAGMVPAAAAGGTQVYASTAPDPMVIIEGSGARLGVRVSDVGADKAKELKLPGVYGARIDEVDPESPAAKAGLQAGDVILNFDGERVRSAAELARLVRETPPGRAVSVEVSRDGKTQRLTVTPEQRQARMEAPQVEMPNFEWHMPEMPQFEFRYFGHGPQLGVTVDELTPQLATYFGVTAGKGLLVREVLAGSAAEKAGLQAGDVIVRADDAAVADVNDLRQALHQAQNNRVTLTIVRNHQEQKITVELQESEPRSPRRTAWVQDLEQELQARGAELQQRLSQVQDEVQRKLDSPEFQQKMRELERKLQRLEVTLGSGEI